jgi:hypothetical protein
VGGCLPIWMRESGVGVTDGEAEVKVTEVDAEAVGVEIEVDVKEVVMKLSTTSK